MDNNINPQSNKEYVFMVTEKCNSNCIMCPMSEDARKRGKALSEQELQELFCRIDNTTEHIDITGGEPFLEWKTTLKILETLNNQHPSVSVQILTNGRALCLDFLQKEILPLLSDRYLFAIPIHGANASLHDRITQSPGSFEETLQALRFLSRTKARIEVRIVGSKINAENIPSICRFLVNSGVRIHNVNIIAMEMNGTAARNRNNIWIDYDSLYKHAEDGIRYLFTNGFDVGLYNFPLCCLPQYAWPLAQKSISDWKIEFPSTCKSCIMKKACGGLFSSTNRLGLCKVHPITEGEII